MTSIDPENVINLEGARERLELRRLIRVGNRALIGAQKHGEMGLIGAASVGETTPPADAKLLDSIRDVALKIHATGGLTGSSIAAYLMLPLKPFDGYRPIDMIAVGQVEAAVDAGLCFIEPDRGFDESLRPGIEQAIKILDATWA